MIATQNLKGVTGIYCAIHRESLACYVGSSKNIGGRRSGHLYAALSGRGKSAFHRALLKHGPESFDLEVIEVCKTEDLKKKEDFWIAFIGSASLSGLNTCSSSAWKGLSDVTLERMRVANLGKKHSEETRRKMSVAALGKKKTEATISKMRAAQSGRVVSEEAKQKQRASMVGKRHTAETRLKIKTASLNRWNAYRSKNFNLAGEAQGEKTPLASAAA